MSNTRTDGMPDDLAATLAAGLKSNALPSAASARIRGNLLRRARAEACGTPSDTIRAEDGGWFALGSGVRMKVLREDLASVSFLLRLEPGARVPAHDHESEEECMVLEGQVSIGELTLTAGDYHLAHSGQPHSAMMTVNGTTLFLRGQMRDQYRAAAAVATAASNSAGATGAMAKID